MKRCKWVSDNELYIKYHDEEWGVPVHNDTVLFEFLILEGAQAGLSWITILKRRSGYRKAFKNFDPKKIAKIGKKDVDLLMQNTDIIRNRLKIESTISNAQAFLKIQNEFGSFSNYLWKWVNNTPIQNKYNSMSDLPPETELSKQISKDLKKRGFRFVGPTICYAYMQAVGLVNDHSIDCFLHVKVSKSG